MINGKSKVKLTVRGAAVSWAPEKNTRPKRKHGNQRNKQNLGNRDGKSLERARRRRVTGLSRFWASMNENPRWFITLMFDRKVQRDWSLEECLAIFEQFKRYLRKNFPQCFWIFVLEWKAAGGLHYHLSGRFGQKKVPSKAIRKKWMELTNSMSRKSFRMDAFVPEHKGYTMKKEKAKNTRHLISILGAKSFWGVINRKNIKRHPVKVLHMTAYQLQHFKNSMMDYAMAEDHEASTYQQLNKDHGTLNFFPVDVVEKAVNSIMDPIEEDSAEDEK